VRLKLRADNTWAAWLWVPDREASAPVWTYGPGSYTELGQLVARLDELRTQVEVVYADKADLDAAGQPKRKTVVRTNAAAEAALGLNLFCRFSEDPAKGIDTQAEAEAFADAALADLSQWEAGVSVDVPFNPALELADMVQLSANGVHFSAAQVLAARSLSHSLTPSGARTTLGLRGKPSIAPRAWLEMEGRPGGAVQATLAGPQAPTGVAAANTLNGFTLSFTAPTVGVPAAEYELHLSTTSGFTPSSATRREVSAATGFDVTGLAAGTTYYAVVVPRDERGNRGTPSAQVPLAPRYVEPQMLQERITFGDRPLNGAFEATNGAGGMPDGWKLQTGTWGTSVSNTTDAFSGGNALLFPAGAGAALLTAQLFTVSEGEEWVVYCWARQGTGGVAAGTLSVTWMGSPTAAVGYTSVAIGGASTLADGWNRTVLSTRVPALARYAMVGVARSGSYAGTLYVDSVSALVFPGSESWVDVTPQNSFTADSVLYQYTQYRKTGFGEVQLRGVITSPDPAPGGNITMLTLPAGYRPAARRLFRVGSREVEVRTDGTVRVIAIGANELLSLEGVRFDVPQ
jgi:hypothetical protein